jgi:hypothetical protein
MLLDNTQDSCKQAIYVSYKAGTEVLTGKDVGVVLLSFVSFIVNFGKNREPRLPGSGPRRLSSSSSFLGS